MKPLSTFIANYINYVNCIGMFQYTHTHTHTHTDIYIYIYITVGLADGTPAPKYVMFVIAMVLRTLRSCLAALYDTWN